MRFFGLLLALPLLGGALAAPAPHHPAPAPVPTTTTHKPAPIPTPSKGHAAAPAPIKGGGLLGGLNLGANVNIKADIKLDVVVTTYLKDLKGKLDYPCKQLGNIKPGTDTTIVKDLLEQIGDILDSATGDLGGMKDKYNSYNGLLGGLLGNKQLDKVGRELQGIIGTVEETLERLPESVAKIPVIDDLIWRINPLLQNVVYTVNDLIPGIIGLVKSLVGREGKGYGKKGLLSSLLGSL